MKVALVIKTAEGGLWILAHIAALQGRGHEVVVVLPEGDGRLRQALRHRGVPVVPAAFDFRFRPRPATAIGLLRLRRQLRRLDADVLHYHLYASALAVRLATWGGRRPRVHMVAGPLYLDSALIRSVERWLMRLDTVVVAGSEHTEQRYRALGRSNGLVTVPYGVDTEHFAPLPGSVRADVRTALGIPGSAFVAIMVAYVYAPKTRVHAGRGIKGHDLLITAWRDFRREYPGSRLIMVGGGFDEAGELHRDSLIRDFDVAAPDSGIVWLDTVADVRQYYAAADVSVCPSLSENHGAALEASSMGVPCIVSDAGGLPETVDEASGWTVPAGDVAGLRRALGAARREWSDGSLLLRAQAARRRMRLRFDRSVAAEQLVDVLERAAGASGGVRIFTEARFGQDAEGRWAAMDAANDGRLWDRYAGLADVQVAARALPVRSSASEPLGRTDVIPLPYYLGARQLVRRSGSLLLAVFRTVAGARLCVLRIPGVVGLAAALACRVVRRPYVVEVVGDPADVLRSGVLGRTGRLAAPLVALLMRKAVQQARACRYVTAETLQRRYPPGRQAPQLSMSNVRLDDSDYRNRASCDLAGPVRLLTIGSQEQLYKGHDVLIRAVADLRSQGRAATLQLVGDGRHRAGLQQLTRQLGLESQVTFHGAVNDRRKLHELLDDSDLFVLPSRTEGLPRALIEAMARGLPAIASAVGGTPELLAADALVPADRPDLLAAKIADFTDDKALREQHSLRNHRTAQRYHRDTLDAVFAAWLAMVDRVGAGAAGVREQGRGVS